MEQDRTADTAALPFTSDAGDLADTSHKIGDLCVEEREHISYTRERILQIREDIEISEDILKVKQLIEAEFDDTKSEDLHFHGRERICYTIDQLLRLQKVAKIPEDILKIKKEFDVETKHPAPSTPSDLIAKAGRLIQQEQMVKYPQRPGELECLYFKKYGTCGFRSACRFHHPSPSALGDPTRDGDDGAHHQEKMEYCEISGETECPSFMEFGSCNFGATCKYHHPKDHLPIMASCNISPNGPPFTPASASPSFSDLSGSPPEIDNLVQQRAQMEDCTWSRGQSECTYFMKFGTCKFGSSCKYKHTQSSATTGSSLADGPIQRPTHMDYTERHHQSDCSYFMEFGTCKFGPACKYQHRRPLASNYCTSQMDGPIPQQSQMEEYSLSPGEPVCSYFIKHGTCKFESACNFYHPSPSTLSYLTTKADGLIHHEGQLGEYPQRPGEPECSYFMKYGTCKFESACKFHHPSPSTLSYLTTEADGPIRHEGQLDEYPQRPGEPECSYFMKHGTCKFRYTCKFHHPAPSTLSGLTVKVDDPVHWEQMEEHPQRPGEPECSYFIKYGTCKFSYSCKFHHPAPSTLSCLIVKVDDPVHQEQMEEYPQRPGEPECSYFIKYGTCKFESACKFHHPSPTTLGGLTTEANGWVRHQGHSEIPGEADCLPTVPLCIISPVGLPLRPGRPTCSYYSRFGTCKFGSQCRFDHPYG